MSSVDVGSSSNDRLPNDDFSDTDGSESFDSRDAEYNETLVCHRDCHVIDRQLLSINISLFNKFVGGIGAADLWNVRRRTRLRNINVDQLVIKKRL